MLELNMYWWIFSLAVLALCGFGLGLICERANRKAEMRALALGMNEQRAREILGDQITPGGGLDIDIDGALARGTQGPLDAYLEGVYSADQLEAIAWWMRNKGQ